jgi:hypothetical protein
LKAALVLVLDGSLVSFGGETILEAWGFDVFLSEQTLVSASEVVFEGIDEVEAAAVAFRFLERRTFFSTSKLSKSEGLSFSCNLFEACRVRAPSLSDFFADILRPVHFGWVATAT